MQCLHPISIRVTPTDKDTGVIGLTESILVPCRKCIACKSNRRSEWSFRLLYESLDSEYNNYFITLTYSDDHLPIKEFENGYQPCFNKVDIQKFIKRLRRHYDNKCQIRFFLSGELGSNTLRPHYHACIFNIPDDCKTFRQVLEKTWKLGRVQADFLNSQRMGYVSKYIMKQSFLDDLSRFDARSPFMLCSQGIGRCYAELYSLSHHGFDGLRPFAFVYDNVKTSIPRYLKNKIFTEEDKFILSEKNKLYRSFHPLIVYSDFSVDEKLEKSINSIIKLRSKL